MAASAHQAALTLVAEQGLDRRGVKTIRYTSKHREMWRQQVETVRVAIQLMCAA